MSSDKLKLKHHQEQLRKTVIRLFFTYLAPFILLSAYFHLQSTKLYRQSRSTHLRLVAEHQANILDLFLKERVVNLQNLIQSPDMPGNPNSAALNSFLSELKKNSDTFSDIGFFDSTGIQKSYAGPYSFLANRDYSSENWFITLREETKDYIISDVYLGFREMPHFTIAVKQIIDGDYTVLRATLDPEKIYSYITSFEGVNDVYISTVNREGIYQVVTPGRGSYLQELKIQPAKDIKLGVGEMKTNGTTHVYGFSWLKMADWAVIIQFVKNPDSSIFAYFDMTVVCVTLGLILLFFLVIIIRAKRIVQFQEESEQTKEQLDHASKLATVGELAGGIAHEINNPLAIISESVGLMKDLMSSEFDQTITVDEIRENLDNIHEAVFRARDITRKLLGFVRKTDIKLDSFNINDIINNVVNGFITREMAMDNIKIIRELSPDISPILTDNNQLEQVLINIINNAHDAISGHGKITLTTSMVENELHISITDTGCGMTREQMDKIFMPFYTTKEVGRGTGLGLSVSYGIIKSLGGKILVDSVPKRGSVFTIVLPASN